MKASSRIRTIEKISPNRRKNTDCTSRFTILKCLMIWNRMNIRNRFSNEATNPKAPLASTKNALNRRLNSRTG